MYNIVPTLKDGLLSPVESAAIEDDEILKEARLKVT